MTVSRLILLRHGETLWNQENRIQGHRDSALNAKGLIQAEALAARLAGEAFDALYSSDLGRAHQTAERIAARTGHTIRLDAGMRERNLGMLEGLTRTEVQAMHPEVYARYRTFGAEYIVPGGESAQQFISRVVVTFSILAREYAGRTVVAVTHGGVLDAMYRHVTRMPWDGERRVPLLNASYNCFTCTREGEWSLPVWGDVAHLQDLALDDI